VTETTTKRVIGMGTRVTRRRGRQPLPPEQKRSTFTTYILPELMERIDTEAALQAAEEGGLTRLQVAEKALQYGMYEIERQRSRRNARAKRKGSNDD